MASTLTVVKKRFPRGELFVIPDDTKKSAYQNISYNKHISPQNKRRLSELGVRFEVIDAEDYEGDLGLSKDFRPKGQQR